MRRGLLVVLMVVVASTASATGDNAASGLGLQVGSRIPADFPVTVSALDGASILLKDRIPPARADAQAVLLVFWATWCAPCIQEIPTLRSLEDFYRPKGFRIVGVAMNEGGDTVPLVKAAMNRHGIGYEVLFDAKGAVKSAFSVPGIPWSVLVDRDGLVRWAGPALPKNASERIRAILTPKEERGSR